MFLEFTLNLSVIALIFSSTSKWSLSWLHNMYLRVLWIKSSTSGVVPEGVAWGYSSPCREILKIHQVGGCACTQTPSLTPLLGTLTQVREFLVPPLIQLCLNNICKPVFSTDFLAFRKSYTIPNAKCCDVFRRGSFNCKFMVIYGCMTWIEHIQAV